MKVSKIYTYQLAEGKWADFIELQKKADTIYSRHLNYELNFTRSFENPNHITEIHYYQNRADAEAADRLHETEPEIKEHFQRFLSMLNPSNNGIQEEIGDVYVIKK